MPALPTNLVKVGSIYKYRARIPQDLLPFFAPKREVVESLRTNSLTDAKRLLPAALLHKSPEGRVSPYPKRIYGIATVTGVPS